jgi:DNA ligase-1
MNFKDLAKYLQKLESTSSRIEITKILAELFKKASTDETDKITYLLLGSLAPSYEGVVFNIADRMMLEVLAKAYGRDKVEVNKLNKELGDMGEVAHKLALNERRKTKDEKRNITVTKTHEKLFAIAQDSGEDSVERKVKKTAELLKQLDPLSAKFVVRIPIGKLRLGFSDKTVLDALSWLETNSKSESKRLEGAYNVLPDVGMLVKNVRKFGIDKTVKNISPKIGVPILPALAQRLKSPKEMIEKMEKVFVEPKFDGLRIQIHFKRSKHAINGNRHSELVSESEIPDRARNDRGSPTQRSEGSEGFVRAFTRNLNENSWMFPELADIGKQINADEVVLDTEAIGVDKQRKTLANFQATMTRRRKHNIEKIASKVKIKFYVFDVLAKNGKNLMNLPYIARRKELEKTIKKGSVLEVVDYTTTKDPKIIEREMSKYLKDGLEGVIVKRADSKYVAGRTGWRWVKMKEEESAKAKLADTVDCVVMGYITGRGKRTQFGIGGFLAGIVDGEKIRTLTKVGTGLTDDQFRELKKRLGRLEVKGKPKGYGEVNKTLRPDVWVEPGLVVELAADEITKSPIHSSGFALRFPRLVKFRDDKKPSQATSVKEMKKLYKLQ